MPSRVIHSSPILITASPQFTSCPSSESTDKQTLSMLARIYGTTGYDILKAKSQFVGTQIYLESIINSLIMSKVTYLIKFERSLSAKYMKIMPMSQDCWEAVLRWGPLLNPHCCLENVAFTLHFLPFPTQSPDSLPSNLSQASESSQAKGTVWFFGFFISKDSHA